MVGAVGWAGEGYRAGVVVEEEGPVARGSSSQTKGSHFEGSVMGRDVMLNVGQGVVGGEGSKAATTHKKAFQNCIALRLERLQKLQQYHTKEEGEKWELQSKQ